MTGNKSLSFCKIHFPNLVNERGDVSAHNGLLGKNKVVCGEVPHGARDAGQTLAVSVVVCNLVNK